MFWFKENPLLIAYIKEKQLKTSTIQHVHYKTPLAQKQTSDKNANQFHKISPKKGKFHKYLKIKIQNAKAKAKECVKCM